MIIKYQGRKFKLNMETWEWTRLEGQEHPADQILYAVRPSANQLWVESLTERLGDSVEVIEDEGENVEDAR